MTTSLFADSYIKLKRALMFIGELESNLDSYRKSKPCQGKLDTSQTPPIIIVRWAADPGLPGAIVGDALHNIRTALDLMASELVRLSKGSDRNVYFPFSESAEALDRQIKEKNFHKAGEDAVDLLKTFRPYRSGNELLRAVHDLDVQDKHKALVVTHRTMTSTFRGSFNIENPEDHYVTIDLDDVYYVFPPDGILAGRHVIQTLKECVELVNGILEAFARMVELRSIPKG